MCGMSTSGFEALELAISRPSSASPPPPPPFPCLDGGAALPALPGRLTIKATSSSSLSSSEQHKSMMVGEAAGRLRAPPPCSGIYASTTKTNTEICGCAGDE